MAICDRALCEINSQRDKKMNANPEVSVIIATHNHAHFLPECLASVRNQTYKDYEVILINNGSTDNTEEVARRLTWDKLRYYYQDDTGSVAGPRNTGIKLAKGKYVAFLDSDDVWYKDKLNKVMQILEEDEKIDIISHDLFFIREGKQKRIIRVGPAQKDMFKQLLIKNRLLGSATVAKRSVMLEINGFDGGKDVVHTEDYDAWLRAAYLKKKFYFFNEPLGEWRAHSSNLSFNFKEVLSHERNVLSRHFKNFHNWIPFYKTILWHDALSVLHFKMGVQYFFRKSYFKSCCNLAKSFFLSPIQSLKSLWSLFFGLLE